jgi:phage repressor protein C with HTH and peptisase S24 domain
MQTSINDRIKDIVSFSGKTINQCAKYLNVSQPTLRAFVNGDNKPSFDVIEKISKGFPIISESWLITGEGEMIKSNSVAKTETRPRIPYDAAAGTLTESIGGVVEYQCEQVPVISAFPKYDFTITIKGNSMEPEFYSGDEVACLRINEKQFIQWGQIHVLDTDQGVIIKKIYDAGDKVRCHSYNYEEYPDFEIAKTNIRLFALVVGQLRLK